MVNDPASRPKSPSSVKAPSRRLSTSLRKLEALHKSSGTDSRLKIPNGKRIKLLHDTTSDSVEHASRTTKKRPNFDIDFSDLKEDDSMADGMCLEDISDLDEFPEPQELLRASIRDADEADGDLTSYASDYSDSDIDALIRDAHLDGITSTRMVSTESQDISASRPIQQALGCKGRKNDCSVIIDKRTHSGVTPSAGTTRPCLRPQVRMYDRLGFSALINDQERQQDSDAPSRLFDPDSDAGLDAPNSLSAEKDDFVLDKSLFDFLGSEATKDPPEVQSVDQSSSVEMPHLSTLDSEEPSFYVAWIKKQREKYGEDWNPVPIYPAPEPEPEHDHLAEFEEWLATTDSIEFIN